MTIIGWFSRRPESKSLPARLLGAASAIAVAVLVMTSGIATAQTQTPGAPIPTPNPEPVVPVGYSIHQSVDLGGHIANIYGSGAMYDTLVNQQSGPRMLGETVEMRALPGNKHPLFDNLSGFSTGFGGDPNDLTRLSLSKGKLYDFTGMFRRDRQYFDYDLLGNPNIPGGQSIAVSGSATPYAWPQVNQSPFLFNTVRRMTDLNLTLFPLSTFTLRAAYSQNIFQGPSLSPSGYQIGGSDDVLLQEYQRNSTDDFTGGIDWKPVQGTKVTFEEQIDHYKADSSFRMDPSYFNVQEVDGTPAALFANYDSLTPYSTSSNCISSSMGGGSALTANPSGGNPIINPACAVITSYTRTAPIRILYPTEILRFQSTSIKNISMNGNVRYTNANMNMPNYYDDFQGLTKTTREIKILGNATAKREVMAADYGIIWQPTKTVSVADQISYSNERQPGTANLTSEAVTVMTTTGSPATNETINNPNLSVVTASGSPCATTGSAAGCSPIEGSPTVGTPSLGYFGQSSFTNNLTASWDVDPRATVSLTWRLGTHTIGQGVPHNVPMLTAANIGNAYGYLTINQDGGILNAAVRPTQNWDVNGTIEIFYNDNAFTPMTPRQSKQYRVHTTYRAKSWATVTAAYTDRERHNNTSNNSLLTGAFVPPAYNPSAPAGSQYTTSSGTPYEGPLNHVEHSRVASLGLEMAPSEHYAFDLNYAYSDVYTATNICYLNGSPTATSAPNTFLPGAVQSATSTLCPYIYGRGATGATEYNGTALEDWFAREFSDAPTQFVSAALALSPNKVIHSDIGYRISDVNGSRFFNDARDVNGSMVSKNQSPYINLAWTVRPGLIWKAEYDYFGYGEGGPSGSQFCSVSTTTATNVTVGGNSVPNIVPCTSSELTGPTGLTEGPSGLTAPRNFHANNVTLGVHYEF